MAMYLYLLMYIEWDNEQIQDPKMSLSLHTDDSPNFFPPKKGGALHVRWWSFSEGLWHNALINSLKTNRCIVSAS